VPKFRATLPIEGLTADEADLVAQALMNLHNEMPPGIGEQMTPTILSIITKLQLKPAIARAAELLTQGALALSASDKPEGVSDV